ncbi:ADP-ribose pyrophosphatase YjhB (NUDIX family) [Melghiribacillus thermohalophilus]|uniref:ADP-ribose pyrophosphatase YjhB (NUDIX family) n=1 Tax=Melghiribacillus thermohalophilus TaxID=1324956 RepID=A0A4R3MVZ7_9BACI|nr:NUDIX hydrolase [Melghiribacillus thermohalophilus]TCT18054.1 ADP-ribose pyrophosphatase YjhB (NUDIX family) [Melghiribacillus thermohalophilus]
MGYVEELRKLVGKRPVILTGAVVVVMDDKERILLQQRPYPEGIWGLPGGLMELGESTEDTARRELLEETGLSAGKLKLASVYSGPEHFVKAENGDEFYVVTIAYYTREYEGILQTDSSETIDLKFFHPDELPENMVKSHRKVVEDVNSGNIVSS